MRLSHLRRNDSIGAVTAATLCAHQAVLGATISRWSGQRSRATDGDGCRTGHHGARRGDCVAASPGSRIFPGDLVRRRVNKGAGRHSRPPCPSGRQLERQRAERAIRQPQRERPWQPQRQHRVSLCELTTALDDAFRNRPASCLPGSPGGKKKRIAGVLVAARRSCGERSPVGRLYVIDRTDFPRLAPWARFSGAPFTGRRSVARRFDRRGKDLR